MKAFVQNVVFVCFSFAFSSAFAGPSVPSFYESVMQMSPHGKLGQVIKKEQIKTSVKGAQAWRIAYISSDVSDNKTISTAIVVSPLEQDPKQSRPIMAWAHGTTGTAQNCGPSQVNNPAVPLNQYFLVGGNSWTDYGIPELEAFIREGYVVVGTDYQGLGGGGRHQYLASATQGRDVINSARAVGSMTETGAGKKAIVYGWSQGGGTALAAASMGDYIAQKGTVTDAIEFVGFVAMAPPDLAVMIRDKKLDQNSADIFLRDLVAGFSDNIFNFTHLAMNLWGTQAAFPKLSLTDVFTDQGARAIDEIFLNKCVHVAADTLNYSYANQFKSLLKDKPTNTLEWAKAFVKGSVAPVKPVAPVVIYWGTKDTVVPPLMGELYQKQMCAKGANVNRIQLAGEQTHFSTPGTAAPLYMPWVKDRLSGKPLENACPRS